MNNFYRPELADVQIHSLNRYTNKHSVVARNLDYEYSKLWINAYAEQNEMKKAVGKYWNELECIWIWVQKS